MNLVVDASVAIKWYVKEEFETEASLLLSPGFALHGPELLLPEFGNIVWKKFRSGELTQDEALSATQLFSQRAITFHGQSSLLYAAVFGACASGQTVYDWIYLALAVVLDCPFVTADSRFFKAIHPTDMGNHIIWVGDVSTVLGQYIE